ncbi:MAG: hypothetical protein EBY38_08750 [Flavobacteriaceae bacterium]|nr:hypothetical protein [Flavobacteriaceae bacterium]
MPIRAIITDGTTADCSQASDLIHGFSAQALLADRGYDSNSIVQQALDQLIQPVIPPKKESVRDFSRSCPQTRYLAWVHQIPLKTFPQQSIEVLRCALSQIVWRTEDRSPQVEWCS